MEALDNLVKINQLKVEPFDGSEFAGMLRAGDNKLKDSQCRWFCLCEERSDAAVYDSSTAWLARWIASLRSQ